MFETNGILACECEFVKIQRKDVKNSNTFEIPSLDDLESIIKVLVDFIISKKRGKSKAVNRLKVCILLCLIFGVFACVERGLLSCKKVKVPP